MEIIVPLATIVCVVACLSAVHIYSQKKVYNNDILADVAKYMKDHPAEIPPNQSDGSLPEDFQYQTKDY